MFLVCAPVHAGAAAPLSLAQALAFALEHSPTLDSSRRQSLIADLQKRNALAGFLPSLDLSSNAGFKQSQQVGLGLPAAPRPPWTSDLNVALSETLYDNGATITSFKIAGLNAEVARLNYEGARDKLVLDVTTNYYAYALNVKLLDAARGRTNTLQKQFASVSAQYRQGLRTRQDFLRFKTQVQLAQIDQVTAESNIRTAVAALRQLIGVAFDDTNPPEFAADEPRPLDTAKEVSSSAPSIDGFYQIRVGKLQVRVNELNETFAKRLWLPQITANAAASYDNNGFLDGPAPFSAGNNFNWNGQIALTYNIWDWGTRARNVDVAAHARGQADDAVATTNLSVRQSVDTLMVQLATYRSAYELNSELMGLSQQSYSFLEEQYRLAKITYLDLITGLNDLLTAKTQYYNAYYSLLQALAQYRYYEGTIYGRFATASER